VLLRRADRGGAAGLVVLGEYLETVITIVRRRQRLVAKAVLADRLHGPFHPRIVRRRAHPRRVDLEAPGLRVLEKTIFSLAARGSAFSTITAVLGVGLGRSKDNRPLYYSDGNCRVQSGDFGLSGGLRGDPGTAPVGASSRHRNGIMPDAHCSCGAIT